MSTKRLNEPILKLKNYFIKKASSINDEFEATNTDGHPSGTGNKRENLLIRFLNEHLPTRYEAFKGGSIFDSSGSKSDQVDVIIYDKNTPRLGSESETLFLSEGVACAVEVKPDLSVPELEKAFEKIISFKRVTKAIATSLTTGKLNTKVYSGVFAFTISVNPSTILKMIEDHFKDKELDYCLDFICVNNKFLIIKNDGSWKYTSPEGVESEINDRFIYFPTAELSLYKLVMIMCKHLYPNYLGSPDFSKYINLY